LWRARFLRHNESKDLRLPLPLLLPFFLPFPQGIRCSNTVAFAFAVALAFLSVIPAGNLLLSAT
jgi:hypothetical protein